MSTLIHQSPKLYACFLIWLLAELFENLPEVGDADRPKFVLFFDEAHLIFDDAPDVLVDKDEVIGRDSAYEMLKAKAQKRLSRKKTSIHRQQKNVVHGRHQLRQW